MTLRRTNQCQEPKANIISGSPRWSWEAVASGEEDQTRVGGGERVDGAVRPGQTPLFLGVCQELLEHVSREGTRFYRSPIRIPLAV